MNLQVIETCIAGLTAQIAACQDAIKALNALNGSGPPFPQGTTIEQAARRKPLRGKPRAARLAAVPEPNARAHPATAGAAVLPIPKFSFDEKPDSVGRAMKAIIHGLNGAAFTGEALRATLRSDPDWNKLLGEHGASVATNLSYWRQQGYLKADGEPLTATYTVAKAEWFAPK